MPAAQHTDPAPLRACTVSRNVAEFDSLVLEMQRLVGGAWGDLPFEDTLAFLAQPEAAGLEFMALALKHESDAAFEDMSDILMAARAKGIKVIVIAEQITPAALHRLLRSGAADFVPYPLPDGALADTVARLNSAPPDPLASLCDPPAPQGRASKRQGSLLPVHGMAGGVGSTTFAVNLAWELASPPKARRKAPPAPAPRVLLMDLDFQFGSVATYLDLPRRDAVFELLSDLQSADHEALQNCLQPYGDRLQVLTAPSDMLPLDFLQPEDMGHLLDLARTGFDFVVIDMPCALVSWTDTVLHAADLYFALLELDMRSAQNTLRLLRTLRGEDLPAERLRYVLNRAPGFTDLNGKARVKRLAESLDIDIELRLPDGQRQVAQACDHGQPLAETAPKLALRKEIAALAEKLRQHAYDTASAHGA